MKNPVNSPIITIYIYIYIYIGFCTIFLNLINSYVHHLCIKSDQFLFNKKNKDMNKLFAINTRLKFLYSQLLLESTFFRDKKIYFCKLIHLRNLIIVRYILFSFGDCVIKYSVQLGFTFNSAYLSMHIYVIVPSIQLNCPIYF